VDLGNEPLTVLAPEEHLELDAEPEVGREGIVDDGADAHALTMTCLAAGHTMDALKRWFPWAVPPALRLPRLTAPPRRQRIRGNRGFMHKRTGLTSILLTGCLLIPLSASVAALADNGRERIRLNRTDVLAARVATARRSDLRRAGIQPASGWKGGPVKVDNSPGPPCANFHPKESDLVQTGQARTVWHHGELLTIESEADVLKTPEMVRHDWNRNIDARGFVPCLQSIVATGLPAGVRLVWFDRIRLHHIAPYAAGFRAVLAATIHGHPVYESDDFLAFGRNRTELTLFTVRARLGPPPQGHRATPGEVRLARILLSRVRA